MTGWIFWWLVSSLVAGIALLAIVAGVARQVLVLGRALQRFQDEVRPTAEAIAREGARLSERGASVGKGSPFRSS